MINRKNTIQAAKELAAGTIDENLKQRYGTSIDEYMSRNRDKEIKKEISKLREQFQSIDKDKDSLISKDELKDFLNKTSVKKFIINFSQPNNDFYDDEYIEKIYKILDKNPNKAITVNEFVESYISLSEKIKLKSAKLERMLIELNDEMEKNNEGYLREKDSEQKLDNGFTSNSNLYISVIEAKNLNSSSLISECDSFVLLTLDNQSQRTLIKKSTNNPAWNESFKFEIRKENLVLKVEVYDQTFTGNKLIGYVPIQLNSFKTQEKVIQWYDLFLEESNENNGEILLKIQYIISLKKYYENELRKNLNYKNLLEKNSLYLQDLVNENNKNDFGMIYSKKMNENLYSNNLKKIDDLIANVEKDKNVIWAKRPYEGNEGRDSIANRLTNVFSTRNNKIGWNKKTQFLMFLYIVITTFSLLERTDFFNFFISFAILILFFYDKNNESLDFLQPLIYSIVFSLIYDLVWFILQYNFFFVGYEGDLENNYKKFVFILDIFGFLIKILMIGTLNSLKKKKMNANL